MWSILLEFPQKPPEPLRLSLENALETFGEALSSFESDGGKGWRIEVLSSTKPKKKEVAAAIRSLSQEKIEIYELPEKDWVKESERGLSPISIGPFFIHGSHFKGQIPQRQGKPRITFCIDAGMAFGTGRHETTELCLKALLHLAEKKKYRHPLDLGTGTGILAFAAARLFNITALAADNDKDAVRIARENAKLNHCHRLVRILRADHYLARPIKSEAPFDLVLANILAGPLMELAPGLARVLAKEGRAILSGLLRDQEAAVLAAHEAVGLTLDFRMRRKEWSALVLKHKASSPKRKPAAKGKAAG